MKKNILYSLCFLSFQILAQDNNNELHVYTPKHFVIEPDYNKFSYQETKAVGMTRTYENMNISYYDVSDDGKTFVMPTQYLLVCVEGYYINEKKNGQFNFYIMDSLNPKKRYKIWEQSYQNGLLNGYSKSYALNGNLVNSFIYKNNVVTGELKQYKVDGKSIDYKIQYEANPDDYTKTTYFDSSNFIESIETYKNKILNGKTQYFYPNSEKVEFEEFYRDGRLDGIRTQYYPSGKVWVQVEYQYGKAWNVLGCYLENGEKLIPGTLKEGNGTLLLYDKKGKFKKSFLYYMGEEVQGY